MGEVLKPCPDCGGKPRAWGAQKLEADGTCLESIGCANDDCAFQPETDYLPWDDAIAAWNRITPAGIAALAAHEQRVK